MKIVAILLFSVVGLFGQQSQDCADIVRRITDNSTSWYGVGTSEIKRLRPNKSVNSATKQALESLSSKININIESSTSIVTNEIIGAKRAEFLEKSSRRIRTSSSQKISDYEIVYSSPCAKKEYLVVIGLNQNIFFRNQEQKIQKIY